MDWCYLLHLFSLFNLRVILLYFTIFSLYLMYEYMMLLECHVEKVVCFVGCCLIEVSRSEIFEGGHDLD